jgi:REP-associated tyrosine transposase
MIARGERQMSHAFVQAVMHVVFSTKERRKLIPKDRLAGTWAYMAGVCQSQKIFVHEIGGIADHAHLLIQIPSTIALADAVLAIKTASSQWLGESFEWQRGYGAFSVSSSNIAAVIRYIRNQEAHHRKMSFEEELIGLLNRHNIPFDPRYVFG